MQKYVILKALESTEEILSEIPEPERSLSFPVILAKLLQENLAIEKMENHNPSKTKEKKQEENFSGLTGGFKLLLNDGFFKTEKTQVEIFTELKRQGYHYPSTSLPKTLQNFIQKRILTRYPGKDGKWQYIERK